MAADGNQYDRRAYLINLDYLGTSAGYLRYAKRQEGSVNENGYDYL